MSSRCSPWVRPSSPDRGCSSSTSSASAWRPIVVEQLLGIVRAIHANGTTVVLVEQSVNVAITLAERAVFLEKGEVRFDGATSELLRHPEILRAVFLDGAPSTKAAEPRGVAAGTNGHRPFVAHCEHCGHDHPVALKLDGLSASFGGVRAVHEVDLAVHQGQILGIIGPNGAGKTTVLDLISGFVTPSGGRVHLQGVDVTGLAASDRAEQGLGRSFQDARLFPSMTVRQTIATACERHVDVRDPISPFVLSPAVKISERAIAEEVDGLIELMRLEAYADKFVGELSTGTRRVVDLACTLAHRPSVLLLDEPSSGIAQRETEALGPVLLDIRDKTGAAMIVIEHDMPLISSISDELLALELGSVVACGPPDEVLRDPRVVEGYLGTTEETIMRSGAPTKRRVRRAPAKVVKASQGQQGRKATKASKASKASQGHQGRQGQGCQGDEPMRSARSLRAAAAAVAAIGVGGWLAPGAHGESSPPIVETGWWSRDLLAQPVTNGGFAIGWALEQEQSAAALRIDLSGDLAGTVYLELKEIGGTAPDLGLARVCVTEGTWGAANPGPYDALPEAGCAAGETADLGRDASALSWLGDITPLVAAADGRTLSLLVRPVGKPLADGVPATAPFQVQFDRASLLVDPGSSGSPPSGAEIPPAGPPIDVGGGSFVDPGLPSSDFGSGFESPPLPEVASPGATTPTTAGPTPDGLVALGPVDVTPSKGKPWVRVVLLVPISAGIGFAMAAARRWRRERAVAYGLA